MAGKNDRRGMLRFLRNHPVAPGAIPIRADLAEEPKDDRTPFAASRGVLVFLNDRDGLEYFIEGIDPREARTMLIETLLHVNQVCMGIVPIPDGPAMGIAGEEERNDDGRTAV